MTGIPAARSKEAAVHGITDLVAIVFGAPVPAPPWCRRTTSPLTAE